jgi:4-alpha-glucanotransferase
VMALQHLYLIPAGMGSHQGAYVQYPMEDLIGILALESQRNRCMVVGEDLGTVPDGFRERMQKANILSYRVLFFEQESKTGAFRKPKDYPRLAVAVASNHDLPTVPAWWMSLDIELRNRLKLYPDAKEVTFQAKLRQRDQEQLRRAMEKQGLLDRKREMRNEDWVPLVYRYLAMSGSFAALIQLDDVTGELNPVNLPGSTNQYPNWRRKLSVALEDLFETALVAEVTGIFDRERGAERSELRAAEAAQD